MKIKTILSAAIVLTMAASGLAQSRAVVTSANANVRKSPSGRSQVIGSMQKGAPLAVLNADLDDDWTKVRIGGDTGWVRRSRIRVLMDDPYKNSAWLFMGRSPKTEGFIISFYLNTSQIIRKADEVRFWTRMVPDNKPAYFRFVMDRAPKKKPADFRFNMDLWEGNCSSGEVGLLRSLFQWRSNEITRPVISDDEVDAGSDSAAKAILHEACKAAQRAAR